MTTYYQANGWAKFYEEDIYNEGCIPHTGGIIDGNELFKADTLDGLLNELIAFTGANYEDIQLNSCDEVGRVDISIMENADGARATKREIELWKEAEIQLWDCIYTFTVEKIQAETVNLEELTA
jgi:hypothetical protein